MNAYVVDLSFFSFFFLMGSFLSQLDVLFSLSSFFPLVLYWLVGTLVIVFGLMPILMHYFFGIKNAHKLLWNFRKTLIYSFLSQDRVGSLAFLIRESRENCLVPRYLSSFQAPLYALFFRGGNAFITVIAFVALIKSYSSLSIGLDQILSLCFFVFLSSFFLLEGKGILLLGLGWLGVYYGNNMDQAHLNLLPIVMLMGGFSTFLDTLVNAYCLVGVSHSLNLKSHYLA
jgi:Na+/H+-dicarboxylate symporter